MPPVVVADADVLFGSTTRALFIHLTYAGAIQLRWSRRILSEMSAALVRSGRKPSTAAALANERLMNGSVEAALVDQARVDRHEPAMRAYVKDERDAHVVACAYELVIGGRRPDAHTVVLSTRNLRDYRIEDLSTLGIDVCHPDAFLISLPLATVAAALRTWRETLGDRLDAQRLLLRLEKDGNKRIATALRAGLAAGLVTL